MDKSILVIDTPKNCWACPLHIDKVEEEENKDIMVYNGNPVVRVFIPRRRIPLCPITRKISVDSYLNYFSEIPNDCPLKPLPQRKPIYYEVKTDEVERNIGYNSCIDEILGETK